MKIFLPFKKELNPYLEEIIKYSKHTYTYASFQEYNASYQVVNIHWPEALFDWKEPTSTELELLQGSINEWKKNAVLIYTKHDFQRNKGTTPNFSRLFELIEKNTDVFIHLGKFSQIFYQEKYPLVRHEIIYHPLYNNSFSVLDKKVAREKLRIESDDLVIIVPGTIRSYEERDLILNAFNSLNIKNKILICINMHAELRYEFPGRIKLKKIIDLKKHMIDRFKLNHQPPKYLFSYGTQCNEDLEIKTSAADIIFVPRIQTLNSGMLFLGLTFNKIIVGPSIGNINEQLREFGLPIFNPKNKRSVRNALYKGVNMSHNHSSYSSGLMKKYLPESVAKQLDDLLNSLL
jgi:hypothetical protein